MTAKSLTRVLLALLLALLAAGCSATGIDAPVIAPAGLTATAPSGSITPSPASTNGPDVAPTVAPAVALTSTARVPAPSATAIPSATPQPPTAAPPTDTPVPTATASPTQTRTRTPRPLATRTPAPQVLFVRPKCGTSYTIEANRTIELRYGTWGAANVELAQQNAQHMSVRLTVDGQPVAGGVQSRIVPTTDFPCNPTGSGFGLYYIVQLRGLSAGEHHGSFVVSFDVAVTDGWSWYGPGDVVTYDFTIIAQ